MSSLPFVSWRVVFVCVALACASVAALLDSSRFASQPIFTSKRSLGASAADGSFDIHGWGHFRYASNEGHWSPDTDAVGTKNAQGGLPFKRLSRSATASAKSAVTLASSEKARHSNLTIGIVQLADKGFQSNQVLQYATIRAYANTHGYEYHLIDPEETAPDCQTKHADF